MGERAPAALSFSRARVRDGDSDGDDDGGGDGDGEREGEGNRAALMMTASCNSVTASWSNAMSGRSWSGAAT